MVTTEIPTPTPHPEDVYLPNYTIFDLRHKLSLPPSLISEEQRNNAKETLLIKVKEDGMLPLYFKFCQQFGWTEDSELVETLEAANNSELAALDSAIRNAEDNYGDVEIRDALHAKANFYCRIGDDTSAVELYAKTFDKTVGAGGRLDIIQTLIRLGLCLDNATLVKKNIARAKKELERGGDWERMNKLKVLEGLHLLTIRKFKEASHLFLEATPTFTATEMLTFENLVFYTIILGMLSLDRPVLKAKVIANPEVLQVVANDTVLREFVLSFYQCNYKLFMYRLVSISERVRVDRYCGRHYRYFVRNIRLRAYQQFLEPYKSVTLRSMAEAFCVSENFIEEEILGFIASSRLHCKIDKVNGILESNRPDSKDALYFQTLKEGDILLNKVQKLSRV